jgi:hypothetical protein
VQLRLAARVRIAHPAKNMKGAGDIIRSSTLNS